VPDDCVRLHPSGGGVACFSTVDWLAERRRARWNRRLGDPDTKTVAGEPARRLHAAGAIKAHGAQATVWLWQVRMRPKAFLAMPCRTAVLAVSFGAILQATLADLSTLVFILCTLLYSLVADTCFKLLSCGEVPLTPAALVVLGRDSPLEHSSPTSSAGPVPRFRYAQQPRQQPRLSVLRGVAPQLRRGSRPLCSWSGSLSGRSFGLGAASCAQRDAPLRALQRTRKYGIHGRPGG
jgi:hypothetical protein